MIKIDLQNRIADGNLSLSNAFIKLVAEKVLADFCPNALKIPQPIDVDRLITSYLAFDLRYEYLSHNSSILGMTNFTRKIIDFYDPVNHDIIEKQIDENTVLIDSRLTAAAHKGRYAFTAAHECGHIIFDNPAVRQLKEESRKQSCEFEFGEDFHVNKDSPPAVKSDKVWIEHFCDYFSSCLILPDQMVKMVAVDVFRKSGIKTDCVYPHSMEEVNFCVDVLAKSITDKFDASKQATIYKLCDLKLIRGGRNMLEIMRTEYKD